MNMKAFIKYKILWKGEKSETYRILTLFKLNNSPNAVYPDE